MANEASTARITATSDEQKRVRLEESRETRKKLDERLVEEQARLERLGHD